MINGKIYSGTFEECLDKAVYHYRCAAKGRANLSLVKNAEAEFEKILLHMEVGDAEKITLPGEPWEIGIHLGQVPEHKFTICRLPSR